MADALCGPSNALQSFQKHTQVDRTLQQDRRTQRQPSHENFRSGSLTPNPQAEAEFEAFQRGLPAPQSFLSHPAAPLHHQHHNAQPLQQPAGIPSWATDFQSLSLDAHNPLARQSPIPAAHFKHEAPLQRSSPGPWHTEFMRHETATPPLAQHHNASQWSSAFRQPSYMDMNSMMSFGTSQSMTAAQAQAPIQGEQFDDAAFAAAFDNAASMFGEPMQETAKGKGKAKEESTGVEEFSMDKACVDPPELFGEESYMEDEKRLFEERLSDLHAPPNRSYRPLNVNLSRLEEAYGKPLFEQNLPPHLHQPPAVPHTHEEQQEATHEREADELSRTAGQLLDNLRDEQSEKFQKSNFMTLMRQLRDKEVRVDQDGERFVETAQALHPGGPTYPGKPKITLTEDRYSTGDALV